MPSTTFLLDTINQILSVLFEREEKRINNTRQALARQNVALGGAPDGFRHMGVIYTELTGRAKSLGTYGNPSPELLGDLSDLMADEKTIQLERDWIRQALVLVLRDCKTNQDIRDAIPNGLKDFLPGCERLERTRPEAFTIAENPRAYKQYMELREKIEFYLATRLIY